MQPMGNPLANVGTPVAQAAAQTVLQQIAANQKAQTDLLQKILAQSTANTAASVANIASQRIAGGGQLFQKFFDANVQVMKDIKQTLTRAAFTGPQAAGYQKSVELLLMSFGVFLAPAVMMAAAGMLTLADIINRKLMKDIEAAADGLAEAGVAGVKLAEGFGKIGTAQAKEDIQLAEERAARQRGKGERMLKAAYDYGTAPGHIDRGLRGVLGRPYDLFGGDTDQERKQRQLNLAGNNQPNAGRGPETPAQRDARIRAGGGAAPSGQPLPGGAVAGQIAQPKEGGGVMGDFAKNFRQVMQDMRQSYVRAPVMTGIGDLWREMQMRVYQSPLEQRKLIMQEQMFLIAGRVLEKLDRMAPKEN